MQTKLMIINNEYKEMSFDEVLEQFTPAIHKEINIQKSSFSRDKEEREDMFQVGCLWLWKAYNKYDVTTKNHFSTLAFSYIKRGVQDLTLVNNAQKRDDKGKTTSMYASLNGTDEDFTLSSLVSEETDIDSQLLAKQIIEEVSMTLTEKELKALSFMIDERHSTDLAEEEGITRQCSASRYRSVKAKIKAIAEHHSFMG